MAGEPLLRPATEADKEYLWALRCATMRELIEKTWGWDETSQRHTFDKDFVTCRVLVIEVESRKVGTVWFLSREDVAYICELQIAPYRQGQGIGTAVLRRVIGASLKREVPVQLCVLEANPRAQRLYERLGFKVTGRTSPFIHMQYGTPALELAQERMKVNESRRD